MTQTRKTSEAQCMRSQATPDVQSWASKNISPDVRRVSPPSTSIHWRTPNHISGTPHSRWGRTTWGTCFHDCPKQLVWPPDTPTTVLEARLSVVCLRPGWSPDKSCLLRDTGKPKPRLWIHCGNNNLKPTANVHFFIYFFCMCESSLKSYWAPSNTDKKVWSRVLSAPQQASSAAAFLPLKLRNPLSLTRPIHLSLCPSICPILQSMGMSSLLHINESIILLYIYCK